MKFDTCWSAFLALLLAVIAPSLAWGAPSIVAGMASGNAGESANIELQWDSGGGSYRALQFDVAYDPTLLDAANGGACIQEPYVSGYLVSACNVVAPGRIRLGILRIDGDIPDGTIGSLLFDITPLTAPAIVPVQLDAVVVEGDVSVETTDGLLRITRPPEPEAPPELVPAGSMTGQLILALALFLAGILQLSTRVPRP